MQKCLFCGATPQRKIYSYCSNKCQHEYSHREFIAKWKLGELNIVTKNVSAHLKRYLHEKYGEACRICGWNRVNVVTGKVPLEVNHIDGNSSNNIEANLELICPNCHSLTANFRNLNKGSGRSWRRVQETR